MTEIENGLLKDIVDGLLEEIEEVKELTGQQKDMYNSGRLLAYATALGIIKSKLAGYDLKDYNLDFDIDKKYL